MRQLLIVLILIVLQYHSAAGIDSFDSFDADIQIMPIASIVDTTGQYLIPIHALWNPFGKTDLRIVSGYKIGDVEHASKWDKNKIPTSVTWISTDSELSIRGDVVHSAKGKNILKRLSASIKWKTPGGKATSISYTPSIGQQKAFGLAFTLQGERDTGTGRGKRKLTQKAEIATGDGFSSGILAAKYRLEIEHVLIDKKLDALATITLSTDTKDIGELLSFEVEPALNRRDVIWGLWGRATLGIEIDSDGEVGDIAITLTTSRQF